MQNYEILWRRWQDSGATRDVQIGTLRRLRPTFEFLSRLPVTMPPVRIMPSVRIPLFGSQSRSSAVCVVCLSGQGHSSKCSSMGYSSRYVLLMCYEPSKRNSSTRGAPCGTSRNRRTYTEWTYYSSNPSYMRPLLEIWDCARWHSELRTTGGPFLYIWLPKPRLLRLFF